jgi:hypothetical protein
MAGVPNAERVFEAAFAGFRNPEFAVRNEKDSHSGTSAMDKRFIFRYVPQKARLAV